MNCECCQLIPGPWRGSRPPGDDAFHPPGLKRSHCCRFVSPFPWSGGEPFRAWREVLFPPIPVGGGIANRSACRDEGLMRAGLLSCHSQFSHLAASEPGRPRIEKGESAATSGSLGGR